MGNWVRQMNFWVVFVFNLVVNSLLVTYAYAEENIDVAFIVDGVRQELPAGIVIVEKDIFRLVPQQRLIQQIVKTSLFRNVKIYANPQEKKLVIEARRQYFIRSINVEGFDNQIDLKRNLFSKEKDFFDPIIVKNDAFRLRSLLNEKGYPNALIDVKIKRDQVNYKADVSFNIQKGKPCILSEILIEPNAKVLDYITVPVTVGSICDVKEATESLEREKRRLIDNGYLQADVRVLGIDYSPDREKGILKMRLERGKRTRIEIFDLTTGRLNNDARESDSGLSGAELNYLSEQELKEEVLQAYRSKGYYSANIQDVMQQTTSSENLIKVKIKSGKLLRIDRVICEECALNNTRLEEIVDVKRNFLEGPPPFIEEELERMQTLLKGHFLDGGYADVVVEKPDYQIDEKTGLVTIRMKIVKGRIYKVAKIDIVGLPEQINIYKSVESQTFTENSPLSNNTINDFAQMLRIEMIKIGYAYAQVTPKFELTEAKEDVVNAKVTFQCTTGTIVRIRNIRAEGDLYGKGERAILESELKKGDLYTPENLEQARQRLMRHGLFGAIDVTLKDPSELEKRLTEVDIVIKARSRAGYNLALSPGWGNVRGYRFGVEYSKNNLTKDGLRFFSTASVSQEKQQNTYGATPQLLGRNITAGVTEPLFRVGSWVSPLDVSFQGGWGADVQPLSSRIYRTLQYETIYRNDIWSDPLTLSLKFVQETSKSIGQGIPRIELIERNAYRIHEIIGGAVWDRRDNGEWPTKGIKYEVGHQLSRDWLLSDVRYDKTSVDLNIHVPLTTRFSEALLLGWTEVSEIRETSEQTITIPGNRRTLMQGNALIRGYREGVSYLGPLLWMDLAQAELDAECPKTVRPVGGTNRFYAKHETRYRSPFLSNNLGFAWFVDSGTTFFTGTEFDEINSRLDSDYNNGRVSSGGCSIKSAKIIGNDTVKSQNKNLLESYWDSSYISTGLGARLIIPSFASVSIDWGIPIREPADSQENCVPLSDADGDSQSSAPSCVTRRSVAKILGFIPGAFHINIGATF